MQYHSLTKNDIQSNMALYIYSFSVQELKTLAIKQEKVDQSSLAANKRNIKTYLESVVKK